MAETPWHQNVMIRLKQLLEAKYADDPKVYIGSNMFMYYIQGDPTRSVSPDVFITKGAPKDMPGGVYLTWMDGVPTVIFEITSPSSDENDTETKFSLYQSLGVNEYILYDPLDQYLKPRLQGFKLLHGRYVPMQVDSVGALLSDELNARFVASGRELPVFDRTTGEPWRTIPEARAIAEAARADAARARADAEQARADAERARADAEQARADAEAAARRALELEIAELRRQLGEQPPPPRES